MDYIKRSCLKQKTNNVFNSSANVDTEKMSIVTLQTIEDACKSLPDSLEIVVNQFLAADDVTSPDLQEVTIGELMDAVLKLFHVVLVDLQLPMNQDIPDFTDAWSTVINKVGVSVLSAHDAILLQKEENDDIDFDSEDDFNSQNSTCKWEFTYTGEFRDPQVGFATKETFNAAVPVIYLNDLEENDLLATFLFRALSALPLLDLITTFLISGNWRIFPNLNSGVLTSLVMHILNNAGQENDKVNKEQKDTSKTLKLKARRKNIKWAEENLLNSLFNSLEVKARPVGGSVIKDIYKLGTLNPADNVAQLMGAVYWLWCELKNVELKNEVKTDSSIKWEKILKFLAEEWSCSRIMKYNRYNDRYLKTVGIDEEKKKKQELYLDPEILLISKDDELDDSKLYPLELLNFSEILQKRVSGNDETSLPKLQKNRNLAFASQYFIQDV